MMMKLFSNLKILKLVLVLTSTKYIYKCDLLFHRSLYQRVVQRITRNRVFSEIMYWAECNIGYRYIVFHFPLIFSHIY